MKILLLGEYSNVHNTLAQGLRQRGHQVTVASNGDFWKDYPRDTDLARKPGKLGGICLLGKVWAQLPRWRDYDVVQLINPMFLELKAERIFPIYRYLRRHNKCVVMGAFGMDYYWAHECIERKPLRYSDFNIGDELRTDPIALRDSRDWIGTPKGCLNQFIANDCDAIVTGLYEYQVCYQPLFPDKTTFIPYPVSKLRVQSSELRDFSPESQKLKSLNSQHSTLNTQPLKLFIGISKGRSQYKGTDIMLRAAEEVQRRHPEHLELVKAEGVPFDEYQRRMDDCDALMDQLYSYTPAMNALLAMSKGIIVIGGGEPENYDILGEQELQPIVNVQPTYESVVEELEKLVQHQAAADGTIDLLKRQSVEYVRRHHHYLTVAAQYEKLYQQLQSKN
ncbi:MAG: glycosyltransferase family 1 protein [Prevotella sp.]|nr:glycosyltransferase family 1 protein [Prevotella sp.]